MSTVVRPAAERLECARLLLVEPILEERQDVLEFGPVGLVDRDRDSRGASSTRRAFSSSVRSAQGSALPRRQPEAWFRPEESTMSRRCSPRLRIDSRFRGPDAGEHHAAGRLLAFFVSRAAPASTPEDVLSMLAQL
jgi:hypothetical protein